MNGPNPGGGACTHTGHADAATSSSFRRAVRDWITSTVDLDDQRISDIVLATYEALTNCAEHAYQDHPAAGVMTLTHTYDPDQATAKICVSDHGRWLEPDPAATNTSRGHGLTLMRALADTCTITTTTTGTTVCLVFHHCPAQAATTSL
jgi:serine/threonine-protein kinase RsbW